MDDGRLNKKVYKWALRVSDNNCRNWCFRVRKMFKYRSINQHNSDFSSKLVSDLLLLEKVPQDLFHSVYFEYVENSTHDRLLSLNYAFCHIKRVIKTSEPVYTD